MDPYRAMHTLHCLPLIVLGCLALLAACDSGPGHQVYPDPFDLESISVADLRLTAPVPGQSNVRGTVVDVTTCFCPKGAICLPCEYPNGIILSEAGTPLPAGGYRQAESTFLLVTAEDLEQFQVGQRYELSVEVEDAFSRRPVYLARLLGYLRTDE